MSGLECRECGAVLEIAPEQRTGRCTYCASPAVVERPHAPGRPNPSFGLGFVVAEDRARITAKRWLRRSTLFAPSAFRSADPGAVRGVYVPAYLYSAAAHSQYRATIGEHYTVTETYTTTNAQGKTETRTRTRTETEWRPLAGSHAAYVADLVVTASRGLSNAELEAIEPFDMRALHRYTPKLVSGWVTEEPTMQRDECLALARQEGLAKIGRSLGAFMPGDKHRDLQFQTTLHDEDLELLLLPTWVFPVRYAPDRPLVRLLVNGQSGKVWGKAPISKLKVGLAIAAVLVPLIALIVALVVAGSAR